MSGEFRQRIGERYIAFARKWMTYVLTKCESGRGTKPRYTIVTVLSLYLIQPCVFYFYLHAGLKSCCDISVFMFGGLPRGDNTFILASSSASLLSCHGNIVLLTGRGQFHEMQLQLLSYVFQ